MSAALSDDGKGGMFRRCSTVRLVIGLSVFGLLDPSDGRDSAPSGGPATGISKIP